MEREDRIGVNIIKKINTDYEFRTYITSILSTFITTIFASYNTFLGIYYLIGWNIGIGAYYFLLITVKTSVFCGEINYRITGLTAKAKEEKRNKRILTQSLLLFLIDFALIAPIILMIFQEREIHYSKIPAIATAAYTFFKIVIAIVNISKTRKIGNLSVKIIRSVNFKDAIVSVISLQYIMAMTFGEDISGKMATLCVLTSGVIWIVLVTVSLFSLIRAIKLRKHSIN